MEAVSPIDVPLTRGRLIENPEEHQFTFILTRGTPFIEFDIEDEDFDFDLAEKENKGSGLYAYYPNECLMSCQMVEDIKQAGADNLQILPAMVKDVETGMLLGDYLVVNVIGMVSCADMEKSEYDPLGEASYYHELVIQESKIHDLLVFRLAEYPPDIIIHETIANALMDKQHNGLVLEPLKSAV